MGRWKVALVDLLGCHRAAALLRPPYLHHPRRWVHVWGRPNKDDSKKARSGSLAQLHLLQKPSADVGTVGKADDIGGGEVRNSEGLL